jgi:hypothetical protein
LSSLKKINNKNLNLIFAVLAIVIICIACRYRFLGDDNQGYKNSIDGDGRGYYAYLPATFIYHDLSFSFYEKDPVHFGYPYTHTFLLDHHGKNVDKYTCGEAILLVPFFLLATLYSWIFNFPIDGYNEVYQLFCAIGGLFYGLIGLLFVKKYLQKNNLSNGAIAIGIAALSLGTNLLNYMTHESSMSHVYSFAMISCHVFLIKKHVDLPSFRTSMLLGLTLGLLVLIRPVNGIIIFAYPFLNGGNLSDWKKKIRMNHILTMGMLTFLVISIQLIIWKIGTGNFFVFGYKNEGFYFNKPPHIFDYLFSFKRGAFIYSPVLFFSVIGLVFLWKKNAKEFLTLLCFLVFVLYIHASWWSWYYGDGFGARPLVDFYVFFGLLIALAFDALKNIYLKITAIILFIISIGLHQVFFYQYYYWIIHPDSMNYEKFKHVFLETDKKYLGIFNCDPDDFYQPHGIRVIDSALVNFSDKLDKSNRFMYDQKSVYQNNYNLSNDQYLPQIVFMTDSTWINKQFFAELYIEYAEPKNDSAACDIHFMIECADSTDKTRWFANGLPLAEKINHKPGEYIACFERVAIGISKNVGDKVHVYIYNPEKKEILIRNLKIRVVAAAP